MANVEAFRQHILDAGVLDPEGVHHEFVSGMHGRKLDFDTISTCSPLYEEWIDVTASFIEEQFPRLPAIIIGVANGTNRVALDTAKRFEGVKGMISQKDSADSKTIYLGHAIIRIIGVEEPELVVVKEDVGTTGNNSAQVAKQVLEAGAKAVEVIATWKRRPQLERLYEAGIPYRAIIDEPLDTYTMEDCKATGYCAKGWEFIEREK